jgi:hypothetical protein
MILKGSKAGSNRVVQAIKNKKEVQMSGSYAAAMALYKHAQERWN